ncbi:MAG: hypothetical protein JNN30_08465 [Rhodanobacteraceae bacterium]|nr:hypothetical protein [Rhodanobacteraceae bacterium]
MTYCLAWKHREAVYLIADTLVTQGAPAARKQTSLGEPQVQVAAQDFVEERLIKLEELRAGTAVAIAGEIRLAHDIVEFMRDHLETAGSCAALWPTVNATFGPFHPQRHVAILAVESVDGNSPTITRWSSDQGNEHAPRCAWIGSLPPDPAGRIAGHVLDLARYPCSTEAMLLSTIATVQLLAHHEEFIRSGVGGVVCGLRVEAGETKWLEDFVSAFYEEDGTLDGVVSVHVREGTLAINSTYHGDEGSVFTRNRASPTSIEEAKAWCIRWLPYLRHYLNRHVATCAQWIFINRSRPLATVFLTHANVADQIAKHLGIRTEGEQLTFTFSPVLMAQLFEPPRSYPKVRVIEVME